MNGRDRVRAALIHEPADRVPIILGASNTTSMQVGAYRELKAHLGLDLPDRYLYDWPELGTAVIDEVALERLHSDVRAETTLVMGTPWARTTVSCSPRIIRSRTTYRRRTSWRWWTRLCD